MDWHRLARGAAGLSSFGGLRAAAGGFSCKTLSGYDSRHDGNHCRQSLRAIAIDTAGPTLLGKDWSDAGQPPRVGPGESAQGAGVNYRQLDGCAAYIYRNGVEIGRAPVGGLERLSGSYAYSALATVAAGGLRDWISIASSGGRAPNPKDLGGRVAVAPDFLANVRALIIPGTTLVLTDAPVNAGTHSARGFNILTD